MEQTIGMLIPFHIKNVDGIDVYKRQGYALYACIAHMNKFVDSTSVINKDYSGESFVQLSSLSLEEIIRIKEYVDKECINYWSISHLSLIHI